jgi:hypothetical protein
VDVTGFTYDFLFCAATVTLLGGVDRKTHLVVQNDAGEDFTAEQLADGSDAKHRSGMGAPSLLSVIFAKQSKAISPLRTAVGIKPRTLVLRYVSVPVKLTAF